MVESGFDDNLNYFFINILIYNHFTVVVQVGDCILPYYKLPFKRDLQLFVYKKK